MESSVATTWALLDCGTVATAQAKTSSGISRRKRGLNTFQPYRRQPAVSKQTSRPLAFCAGHGGQAGMLCIKAHHVVAERGRGERDGGDGKFDRDPQVPPREPVFHREDKKGGELGIHTR